MIYLSKVVLIKNDLLISLIIGISFIIFSILLPLYDNVNGFHNLLFDKYELTMYEDRTISNLYIVKNILEGKSIFFPKGYLIENVKVEDFKDFVEKDGYFFPIYNFLPNYLYAGILYFIPISSELQLFKGMIFLNILFSAITLSIFYLIQRSFGLNIKYSFLSTLIAGIATSILIYSKYLFIDHTLISLIFVFLIYILLKNRKKRSLKIEIFSMIIFSFLIVFLWYDELIIVFFIVSSYIFIRYKLIRSVKILIVPILVISLILISIHLTYHLTYFGVIGKPHPSGIEEKIKILRIPVFIVFQKYINALDYSAFGYYDQTSVWKLYRGTAYIYAFKELNGNAIFLSIYGLFGTLFGPRGFVFNSPYLIFAILGIFVYKRKRERNLLLVIIILIILCYGVFHLGWQGGFSPKYVRYYTIPILFLTFFSFYYIQSTRNILAKLIFLVLVVLSVLNVNSLAIRTDWNYEHESGLVSYDLVLWPWYESKGINLDLSANQWNENRLCPNFYDPNKISVNVCNCTESGYASKNLTINKKFKNLDIIPCALFSGGDGVYSVISIDSNVILESFIPWNECWNKIIDISKYADDKEHLLKISVKPFGACDVEGIEYSRVALTE